MGLVESVKGNMGLCMKESFINHIGMAMVESYLITMVGIRATFNITVSKAKVCSTTAFKTKQYRENS